MDAIFLFSFFLIFQKMHQGEFETGFVSTRHKSFSSFFA